MADPRDEKTLSRLKQLTLAGLREQENRVRAYDASYDVWRVKGRGKDGLPEWRSSIRVPYAQASIDTALVNVVSGIPRCLVKPRHPNDVLSARAMQQAMDYFTAEAHLAEPQVTFAQQGLIFGVTVAKNYWAYRETDKMVRRWATDPATGLETEIVQPETLVVRDGPCFDPWSVYDCWWDPNGRDVDSCSYIVLRSYVTKDELLKGEYKEYDNSDGSTTSTGKYRNLEDLFQTGPPVARSPTAQETFLGTQDYKRKNTFELWEIWEDDRVTVIGNQQVVLRDIPNPYWHGLKPIVIAQTRPDLFEMQGVAETELLRDIQDAQHTLQNMTIDHLHLSVMAGFTYRAGQVVDPNLLTLRPGFRWPVTDHDDVRPVQMPQLDANVWTERGRLQGDSDRVTGISAYVSGSDSVNMDQTTATGVTAIQSAANTMLRFKARQLHDKGFQRTFEMWGEMIQQFMSKPLWTEVTGKDMLDKLEQANQNLAPGESPEEGWWEVKPQDVVGSYRYNLEGTEESLSQQQARTEALAFANAMAPYVQMGTVAARPIAEKIAAAFDIQDVDALFTALQQPQQPQIPAAPQPTTLQNGTQAPLGVQQAIGTGGFG